MKSNMAARRAVVDRMRQHVKTATHPLPHTVIKCFTQKYRTKISIQLNVLFTNSRRKSL